MENKIKCPRCKKEKHQNKHGKNKSVSKRYLCKHCNKAYTVNPKERKYSENKIKEAIEFSDDFGQGASFNLVKYYKMCNEVLEALVKNKELLEFHDVERDGGVFGRRTVGCIFGERVLSSDGNGPYALQTFGALPERAGGSYHSTGLFAESEGVERIRSR